MKLPLLVGYSLVLFLSAASASQFTTVGLASAEEYFERSQQSAEKLQELVWGKRGQIYFSYSNFLVIWFVEGISSAEGRTVRN